MRGSIRSLHGRKASSDTGIGYSDGRNLISAFLGNDLESKTSLRLGLSRTVETGRAQIQHSVHCRSCRRLEVARLAVP